MLSSVMYITLPQYCKYCLSVHSGMNPFTPVFSSPHSEVGNENTHVTAKSIEPKHSTDTEERNKKIDKKEQTGQTRRTADIFATGREKIDGDGDTKIPSTST